MPISAPPPSWASIKNKPNTVSGFGITDMASQSVANATNATNATNVANVTTTQVANAMAGAAAGAVGSYALLHMPNGYAVVGATAAGSTLWFTSASGDYTATHPSGSWRCMGYVTSNSSAAYVTVWMRYA